MASSEGDKGPSPAAPSHASPTDLFASAKLVAGAAQSTFGNKGEEVDKGKVAGAAADLLDAGSRYGNLEQQKGGVGGYVEQAETYLREYSSSATQKPAAAAQDAIAAAAPASDAAPPAAPASGAGEGQADGGLGGYVKLAKGFFN